MSTLLSAFAINDVGPESGGTLKLAEHYLALKARRASELSTDIQEQFDSLDQSMRLEPAFDAALTAEYRRRALLLALHRGRHQNRYDLKLSASSPRPSVPLPQANLTNWSDAAADAVQEMRERAILDTWILPSGRRLGDVTGEELEPLIDAERLLARGHERNMRFFMRLRQSTPDSGKVRDYVTHEQAMVFLNPSN